MQAGRIEESGGDGEGQWFKAANNHYQNKELKD